MTKVIVGDIVTANGSLTTMPEQTQWKFFDPPSGWRFGMPKLIKADTTPEQLREILIKQGYPEEDIDFALQYSRYWNPTEEELRSILDDF